jgi:hypothetical protein
MVKYSTPYRLVAAIVLAGLPPVIGCGSAQLPVSGVVKFDGKPLEGAGIGFHPRDKGPIGSGATNAQGEFTMESSNKPGLPPGFYLVTVSKKIETGYDRDERVGPGGLQIKSLIPTIYGDPEKTPLTAEVKPGNIRYDLDLSSNPK